VTSSGQYSSPSSGSAGSKNSQPSQAAAFLNAFSHPQPHQPPRTPSGMHNRTRSKTDPVSPPPGASSRSAAPSPRRSSTAPTPASCLQGTPSKRQQQRHRERTGTTPPLTSEGDGDGDGDGDGQEEDGEGEGELRLLTPPPTPPFTARIFSLSTPQSQRHGDHAHLGGHQRAVTMGGGEYLPSPYKTSYAAHVQQLPAHLQQPQGKKAISGLGMGLPPTSRRRVSPADEEEDDDGSSSCSSHHRSNPSQASFPSSRSSNSPIHGDDSEPLSAPVDRLPSHPSPRPQFNARKASVQCRAMQGYVSFASVEGLGEPPRGLNGEDAEGEEGDDNGEGEKRGREKERGVWSGLRKLLGVASTGNGGVVL
ncbi:hypothetical protein CVT26_012562, partial [Gymnopilus dilepis]